MHTITQDTFQAAVLQHRGVVVIDFYADWCAPCKRLTPLLEELEKELPKVKFVKINVETEGQLAAQFDVRSVPTIIILSKGDIRESIMGLQPKEVIRAKITAVKTT